MTGPIMSKSWDDPRIFRGMTAQLRHRRELLAAGHKALGWKLAFGSPAAMERLRISAPLVGFLTDRALVDSGATLSLASWTKPAAEPEIAVLLGKDLPANCDREAAIQAIAALGPAIEVADVDHPSDDVEGTLLRNIYQRHVILGRSDASRAGGVLAGLTARVQRNVQHSVQRDGVEIASTAGGVQGLSGNAGVQVLSGAADLQAPIGNADLQTLTGELIGILQHVANLLGVFGEKLQAGQIVIAGSILPPIWVHSGEEISFQLHPVDTITVRFA
jgi:2-keto-4-pentenoate hydratase